MKLAVLVLMVATTTAWAAPPPKPSAAELKFIEQTNKRADEADAKAKAGDYAAAAKIAREVLDLRIKRIGEKAAVTAESYEQTGVYESRLQHFDEAQKLYERSLAIRSAIDPDSDDVASSLMNLGKLLSRRGQFAKALELLERALALRLKTRKPEDPTVLGTLNAMAETYVSMENTTKAEEVVLRIIAIAEKQPESLQLALSYNSLANIYQTRAEYPKAEQAYLKTLAIIERLEGKDHPDNSVVLANLAGVYADMARFDDVLAVSRRALAIKEKAYGPDALEVAYPAVSIAVAYDGVGRFQEAIQWHSRAFAIMTKTLGDKHPEVGIVAQNLARSHREAGNYARSLELFAQARTIIQNTTGPKTEAMALVLSNLGDTYDRMGDLTRARTAYLESAVAFVAADKAKHPYMAIVSLGLATIAEHDHDAVLAEKYFREALDLRITALGKDHVTTGQAHGALGAFYTRQGRLGDAEREILAAIAIQKASKEPTHLRLADYKAALANVYVKQKQDAKAEALYREALAIAEPVQHWSALPPLYGLATLAIERGKLAEGTGYLRRAVAMRDAMFAAMLAAGSEDQKLKFFDTVAIETHRTIAMNVQFAPRDPALTGLAFETVLRRKGRVLDAMTSSLAELERRASASDRELLRLLAAARAELATWILRGADKRNAATYAERTKLLTDRLHDLETKLAPVLAASLGEARDLSIPAIQAALPEGGALVEIVQHQDVHPRGASAAAERGVTRYLAYVVGTRGAAELVDLGPIEPIDRAVAALRTALADPASDAAKPGRALDQLVMEPIRAHVGDAHQLFVAPDGALNLVPFAAMRDARGHYLVESYLITYLTTGRELLRGARTAPRGAALVIGAPAFGAPAADVPLEFPALAGTAEEATAVAGTLKGARVLTQASATEAAVKAVAGPAVLHIATHGFFLDGDGMQAGTRGFKRARREDSGPAPNPLLRSGLALAGANSGGDRGANDGLLSALEASGLDLHGTRLVTLSACETGVGQVKSGDGVFGLRRALVMSGAETQVMSLWKVSDEATRDLMTHYYAAIARGDGRGAAMRAVQVAMLERGPYRHPFYWAAFIVSGDPAPMTGPASPFKPIRGARGCACSGGGDPSALVLVVVVGVLLRRRRSKRGLAVAAWLALVATAAADPSPKPSAADAKVIAETEKRFTDASVLADTGDYAGALKIAREVLQLRIKRLGEKSLSTADSYEQVGIFESRLGHLDEAQKQLERALAIRSAIAPDSAEVAYSLASLAKTLTQRGDFKKSIELSERGLALRLKTLKPEDPLVVEMLNGMAETYVAMEENTKAEEILLRIIAIGEQQPPALALAISYNSLGNIYQGRAEYPKAEQAFLHVLALIEKLEGKDHPDNGVVLSNLANVYLDMARYDDALAAARRGLFLKEKAFGPDSLAVAYPIENIATTYDALGRTKEAIEWHLRALAIMTKHRGDKHADVGTLSQNVARSYRELGNYAKALELFARARTIIANTNGPKTEAMGLALSNLGDTYIRMGDPARARAAYLESRGAYVGAGQAKHPYVAIVMAGLASLAERDHDLVLAEQYFREALELRTTVHGKTNLITGQSRGELGGFFLRQGKLGDAEREFTAAIAIQKASVDPTSVRLADYETGLANVYLKQKQDARAEALYRDALAIGERYQHRTAIPPLFGLATLAIERGKIAEATRYLRRAATQRDAALSAMLAVGSEDQKLKFFDTLAGETHRTIAMNVQHAPRDPELTTLAFEIVLRRKGRVLDAMTSSLADLERRASASDRELLRSLAAARAELATWILRGADKQNATTYAARTKLLSDRLHELETKLAGVLAASPGEPRDLSIRSIQAALPEGGALVELVQHQAILPRALTAAGERGASRYLAYVVGKTGAPELVDLGPIEPIDRAVAAMRTALADPASDAATPGRAVDELVMKPIRAHLGDARQLFVAPDGALNLVPFAAMRDARGHYLVERYLITYLTTGRDLLHGPRMAPRGAALVIGSPAFGAPAPEVALEFPPLAGTAGEAMAVAKTLTGARVLTEAGATEAAVKIVAGPPVLHIATHGFFLGDDTIRSGTRGVKRVRREEAGPPPNPLLRSGLALAGANSGGDHGANDGLLSALEASSIDLHGTRLVTLSACETGVGEIKSGDGVFGLRRALVMSGAETQVMSLWKVSDEATRDLMTHYYAAIARGDGRGAAMRAVQVAMLERGPYRHPFYWAAFIVSGDPAPMGGRATPFKPIRGARGCACSGGGDPGGLVLVGLVALVLVRRRVAR
ncbi:MAG: CHAT domain-containing protein [Kofleriaceae bacterium]